MDWKPESSHTAKKIYDASLEEGEKFSSRGVHMYKRPYLWRDDSPCHAYADTPTENFIPTPILHTGEDSRFKRILKIAGLALFGALVVACFVWMFIDPSGFDALF